MDINNPKKRPPRMRARYYLQTMYVTTLHS